MRPSEELYSDKRTSKWNDCKLFFRCPPGSPDLRKEPWNHSGRRCESGFSEVIERDTMKGFPRGIEIFVWWWRFQLSTKTDSMLNVKETVIPLKHFQAPSNRNKMFAKNTWLSDEKLPVHFRELDQLSRLSHQEVLQKTYSTSASLHNAV